MQNVVSYFVICICICFGMSTQGTAAEIRFVVGDVLVEQNGKVLPATIGTKVVPGDEIITKNASIAELYYNDGSTIRIFENTRVKITATRDDNENISLINGVIKAKIAKLQKDQTKKVYTPTTVCAIRGTEFFVAVSDSSDSRINMEEGALSLTNPYGEVQLTGDEQATVSVASKPEVDENPKNPEMWKNNADKHFVINAEQYAKRYEDYLTLLEQRSSKQSNEIAKFKKPLPKKQNETKLQQEMEKLDSAATQIADEYFLGDCAHAAVANVIETYKDKKQEILDSFTKVKEQANKVVQQQKANYEAIMAIREAYKKSYEEIKGEHTKSIDQIKDEVKKVKEQ